MQSKHYAVIDIQFLASENLVREISILNDKYHYSNSRLISWADTENENIEKLKEIFANLHLQDEFMLLCKGQQLCLSNREKFSIHGTTVALLFLGSRKKSFLERCGLWVTNVEIYNCPNMKTLRKMKTKRCESCGDWWPTCAWENCFMIKKWINKNSSKILIKPWELL